MLKLFQVSLYSQLSATGFKRKCKKNTPHRQNIDGADLTLLAKRKVSNNQRFISLTKIIVVQEIVISYFTDYEYFLQKMRHFIKSFVRN